MKEGGLKYNDPLNIWDRNIIWNAYNIGIWEKPSFPPRTIPRKLKLTYGCLLSIITPQSNGL